MLNQLDFVELQEINQNQVSELRKALAAGTGTDSALFTGGRALQVESLELTLVNAVFSQDEAKLFKIIKQREATATVHEFTRRDDVGADYGGVAEEGGDSMGTDQDLKRVTVPMKTLSTKREVTLHMLATNSLDDAKAGEKLSGTLTLIRRLEKLMFTGDSSIVPAEFDGLDVSIPGDINKFGGVAGSIDENIIDLRGEAINNASGAGREAINSATRIVRENYGKADNLFMSLPVMQDLQSLITDNIRYLAPNATQEETVGNLHFNTYPTTFGTLTLQDDVFIRERGISKTSISPNKPLAIAAAPTVVVNAAISPEVSHFVAGDNGNYYYMITTENKYGESDPYFHTVAAAVGVGDVVRFTSIPVAAGTGSTTPTGVRIYRSKLGVNPGADINGYKLIGRFAWDTPSAVLTTAKDQNAYLPDTSDAYILTCDPVYMALEWFQLLPLMEFTLYPVSAATYPFLVLLVGALGIKIPKRHVRLMNIGHTSGWYS